MDTNQHWTHKCGTFKSMSRCCWCWRQNSNRNQCTKRSTTTFAHCYYVCTSNKFTCSNSWVFLFILFHFGFLNKILRVCVCAWNVNHSENYSIRMEIYRSNLNGIAPPHTWNPLARFWFCYECLCDTVTHSFCVLVWNNCRFQVKLRLNTLITS